ncbi:MAG: NAD(P)/FAD-dependent oxidoreductase [Actinomycetes bacterium]
MTTSPSYLIVGGGLAGAKSAEALRAVGFDGQITIVSAEAHRPYERPPLSKDYLQDKAARETVFVHPEDWYDENQVDLRVSTTASALDRRARVVVTGDGDRLHYDKLLLATGSSARRLALPGADLDNVVYLRTLGDSDRMRQALAPGVRVTIIGAGWIGLETAAAARAAGADVTVLEHAEVPLVGVVGARVGRIFAELHRDNGVDLRCGVTVTGLRAGSGSSVAAVILAEGPDVPSDLVIVGIGVTPNVNLALVGGLPVDNGIVVDEHMCTSDPDVFAVSDVANAYNPTLGRHLRVEHWANALHQPAVAAEAMVGGRSSYDRLPYFFSDQYDLGMEYTGFVDAEGLDSVVIRGDVSRREFIAFWMRDRRVAAGMNVNVWDVTGSIKALILGGSQIDPAALADPDVPIDELLTHELTS